GRPGDRGQHQLGRRAVAELRRSVVLDLPPAAVAELVGELRLLEGLEDQRVLLALSEEFLRLHHLAKNIQLHVETLHSSGHTARSFKETSARPAPSSHSS